MLIDRESPRRKPDRRPAGYQNWWQLLFVHWQVRPSELEPLLPDALTLDTYEGSAWVGLVLFTMTGIRPAWCPALPGISAFHETNVRTYVHHKGRDPGVWFFSLDAASSMAVQVARRRWHLPYYRAAMSVQKNGNTLRYRSARLWPGKPGPGADVTAEYAADSANFHHERPPGAAIAGTLEFFLAERYLMYAQDAHGRLLLGQVHHAPYQLGEARLQSFEQNLLQAAGLHVNPQPDHVVFCEGVQTEIYPLNVVD